MSEGIKTMKNRNQLANTEEEKIIFFEEWAPDNLSAIANMRFNHQLTPVHELAIEPGMKALLDKLATKNYSYHDLNKSLYDYWFARAYTVLKKYSN